MNLCTAAGMTRQAYYKDQKVRQRKVVEEEFIMELVRAERREHPRMGGRKVLVQIRPYLEEAKVLIGRDRLFALLARYDQLIPRPRRRARTIRTRDFCIWR